MPTPSANPTPVIEQFSEPLLALSQLMWQPEGAEIKTEDIEKAQELHATLRDFCANALTAGEDEKTLLDAAYLRALFHDNEDVRRTLRWFLNNILGDGLQLEDQPHTLTISISGYADMGAIPYDGAFDTAPLAAWISENLSVPVGAIGINATPIYPDECLHGIAAIAATALRTKRPASLAEDNALPGTMTHPDDYDGLPLIFIASLHLKDGADIDRVQARINSIIADSTEFADIPLTYCVGGRALVAKMESPIIDRPFAAFVDCVYDEERDRLIEALDQLEEMGVAMSDLGVDFRTVDDLDDEEGPHCRYEIYLRDGKVRKFEDYGAPIEQSAFFLDTFVDLLGHLGVGEIAIASKIVYIHEAKGEGAPTPEATVPV